MKRGIFAIALILAIIIISCEDTVKKLTTTISGKVTNEEVAVSGAYVILLEAGDSLRDGLSLSNGMITNSNGDYTMVEVSAGDHYVAAIDDVNHNIIFDTDTDRIGYYGDPDPLTGLTIPQTLHIDKGDDIENINITKLYHLPNGQ